MQTICITSSRDGGDYEPREGVRDSLREAIAAHGTSVDLAFWIHTLRRRRPLPKAPAFHREFAAEVNAAWRRAHPWEFSYANEIYVSVLIEGDGSKLLDAKGMRHDVLSMRRYREERIRASHEKLQKAVDGMLSILGQHFDAQRLSIVERPHREGEPVYYSEPLEFLHFLLNLEHGEMPVAPADLSLQLEGYELSFGFDALESRKGKTRRFASILTLKGSPPMPPQIIDRCLQIPEVLVVTQTFDFVPGGAALAKAREARDLLAASANRDILNKSGLQALFDSDQGRSTDFGEQQTSIMLVVDQFRRLDGVVGRVQEAFARQGYVTVREDIRLEDVFWSQIPGNFPFLCRRSPLPATRVATLARLNQFPSGKAAGNHWGNALATLPTLRGTPYSFNFHVGDVGHTAILDFNSFIDERGATLLNFLLASAQQYNGRIIVLDRGQSAHPLIQALDGRYLIPGDEAGGGLNPLRLEDSHRNRAFLTAWLAQGIPHREEDGERVRASVRHVLEGIFALPPEGRTVAAALEQLAKAGTPLQVPASFLDIFGGAEDQLEIDNPILGFDMDAVAGEEGLAVPVFSYLLHRIVQKLDGTPTLLVIHEAWDLLDNDFFTPRIASLLDMLRQHNTAMVVTTRRLEEVAHRHLTAEIMKAMPTKLFIPDDLPTDYFPQTTGLKPEELEQLNALDRTKGEFLIRHGRESVACAFTLTGLDDFRYALSGDTRALRLMRIQQQR